MWYVIRRDLANNTESLIARANEAPARVMARAFERVARARGQSHYRFEVRRENMEASIADHTAP